MNTFETAIAVLETQGGDFLAHHVGADAAEGAICKAIKALPAELSYDDYMKLRGAFMKGKPDHVADGTADKQWNRLFKSTGRTIPKATTAAASAQALAREKKAKELAAMSEADIDKKLKALKSAGFKDNENVVKTYTKELARRDKETNKEADDAIKAERKAITEAIKTADVKTLEAIKKLLKL